MPVRTVGKGAARERARVRVRPYVGARAYAARGRGPGARFRACFGQSAGPVFMLAGMTTLNSGRLPGSTCHLKV